MSLFPRYLVLILSITLLAPSTALSLTDCDELSNQARREFQRAASKWSERVSDSTVNYKQEIDLIRNRLLTGYLSCSNNSSFINELAVLDMYAGKNEEALKHINYGLEKHPKDTDLMVTKSRILYQVGDPNEGLFLLEKAYTETPQNHFVNYEYCGKLIEVNNFKKAIDVCTLSIETGDKNTLPWSYLNRGIAYKGQGDMSAAKKDRASSKKYGMRDWLLVNFLPIDE